MSDISSSDYTSALSELLRTGHAKFDAALVRYVCHTSTIPLATTVDEQSILSGEDETVEVTHSIKDQPGLQEGLDYQCSKKHCMYVGSKTIEHEILPANCPCGKIVRTELDDLGDEIDYYLQPLCFLQCIKELRCQYGYLDSSVCERDEECSHHKFSGDGKVRSNRPSIDVKKQVMFCQNSQSILDGAYSRPLKARVGFSGWDNANTPERVALVLDQLYWFNRFASKQTRKWMSRVCEDFRRFKQAVNKTLHCLNEQLVKKFLLFPCEMEGYRDLAKVTAGLFDSLLRDYMKPAQAVEPTDHNSIYLKMEAVMKEVKQTCCSTNPEKRRQVFDLMERSTNCQFERFWAKCLRRLRRRVERLDSDYTLSSCWINTMSGFSQTRNLGDLPPWVAEHKRKEFRKLIGREKS